MYIGRGEIDDYLLSGNSEPHRLKCSDRSQQAFLDCSVCQAYKVYSEARSDVYFHNDIFSIDTDAFCAMNVYKHSVTFWSQIL